MTYRLHAIFRSLQGEGRNVGRPVTFIRFATCNLACPWCDTNKKETMALTAPEILREVASRERRSVILTGGEPTIQPGLDDLVARLKEAGHWVALETNGLVTPRCADLFDYIAVSPKADFARRYLEASMLRRADEMRIVATSADIVPFCQAMRKRIAATDYYVSPLEQDDKMHYRRALDLLARLNKLTPRDAQPWALSIQMHKVVGLR